MTFPDATNLDCRELQQAEAELQRRINELVDSLYAQKEEGVFRNLCRLAHAWKVDPDHFRRMLLRAHMRPSRASEIKIVLVCPEVCLRFIRRAGGLSWKKALAQARGRIENPVEVAAAALIQRLFDKASGWSAGDVEDGWGLKCDAHHQFRFHHEDHRTVEILRRSFCPAKP